MMMLYVLLTASIIWVVALILGYTMGRMWYGRFT